jgi:hypothetical protein
MKCKILSFNNDITGQFEKGYSAVFQEQHQSPEAGDYYAEYDEIFPYNAKVVEHESKN